MAKPRTPKGRLLEVARRDAQVNIVTPALFRRYRTSSDLAAAKPADVEEMIRSTGFYQNNTRSIVGMA